jgi:DNA-binding GntR family transcriptional regulator
MTSPSPPHPFSQTLALYDHFIEDALNGLIGSGQRLGEVSLSRRWGVGRTPVRETLYRLEQDGIIVRKPKFGTFIRHIGPAELVEIYDVRMANEAVLAPYVVLRATSAELDELHQLAAQADFADCSFLDQFRADQGFHSRLHQLSGLRHAPHVLGLMRTYLFCAYHTRQLFAPHGPTAFQIAQPDHRRIVEVLRSRDSAAAQDVVRQHLQHARDHYAKLANSSSSDTPSPRPATP